MKTPAFTLAAVALACVSAAQAQTHYVDFGNAETSTGNILQWTDQTNPTGTYSLIRYDTGATTGITLSMSGGGLGFATAGQGNATVTGGSLAATYLTPAGMNLLGNINAAASEGPVTMTFAGLDFANFTYELTLTGNRNTGSAPLVRTTVVTIGGVSAFTNVSTFDAVAGSISSTAVTNDTTTDDYNNNNAGRATRFVGINPGADNTFALTIDSTANRWYIGALNLTATPIPEPASAAALFGALALGFGLARRRARG